MVTFFILIPGLLLLALSFAAHFSSNRFSTGFYRSAMVCLVPRLPPGYVLGFWCRDRFNWDWFGCVLAGGAATVAIVLLVSGLMGVLFLADYKRLQLKGSPK